MAGVHLATAIGELRKQISEAMEQSANEQLKFKLGPVDLELQVEIEKTGDAKTAFNVWVVAIGTSGGLSSTEVHRVTLSLQPHMGGEDVDVSRKRPRASTE